MDGRPHLGARAGQGGSCTCRGDSSFRSVGEPALLAKSRLGLAGLRIVRGSAGIAPAPYVVPVCGAVLYAVARQFARFLDPDHVLPMVLPVRLSASVAPAAQIAVAVRRAVAGVIWCEFLA